MLQKFSKKGQLGLGSLSPAVLTLMTLGIIVAITFIILANFRASTTDANAQNAVDNIENLGREVNYSLKTSALNDNLVSNLSIIVNPQSRNV